MFIHPSAEVEPGASIGEGTKIWRHCHVMTGAVIGQQCVLGQGCFVASRVHIGDGCRIQNNVSLYEGLELGRDVFVGPCAVFTNVLRPRVRFPKKNSQYDKTIVGDAATIGANCTIVCGHRIGEAAFVAAGAVVSRDVPARALVAGVPARIIGWVCDCGETVVHGAERPEHRVRCRACGRSYRPASSGGMERADPVTERPPPA